MVGPRFAVADCMQGHLQSHHQRLRLQSCCGPETWVVAVDTCLVKALRFYAVVEAEERNYPNMAPLVSSAVIASARPGLGLDILAVVEIVRAPEFCCRVDNRKAIRIDGPTCCPRVEIAVCRNSQDFQLRRLRDSRAVVHRQLRFALDVAVTKEKCRWSWHKYLTPLAPVTIPLGVRVVFQNQQINAWIQEPVQYRQ